MTVRCYCDECRHNENGYCGEVMIYISNSEMTAAGMLPICTDYEEEDGGGGMNSDRCETCIHRNKRWWEEPCDSCCGSRDGYEPIEEEESE